MKVILLKDVAKVGRHGEIADVNEGHARNFLIPNGLVKVATPKDIQALEMHKKHSVEKYNKVVSEVHTKFDSLNGKTVTTPARVNEKGHLFSSIDIDDVVKAIQNDHGITVEKKWIDLEKKSVKEIGEYPFKLSYEGKSVELILKVVRE